MQLNSQPYIQLENIIFNYGNNTVLDNISFSINKGDYVGIIGPNGGGKTTLLKIILGLLEPISGVVRVMGNDIHHTSDRSLLGYVPQRIGSALHPFPATVEEVVASGRIAKRGLFKKYTLSDKKVIKNVMDLTGTESLKGRLIGSLSGGEMQKVFIARALAGEPKILILDEPTTGVDVGAQKKFYGFLGELNEKHNLTIIFVSHDIEVVSKEAKTIICLNKTLICEGPTGQIMHADIFKKLYGDKINVVVHKQ